MSAAFPPERRGSALGIFFAVTGLAVASGPLVGGAVVEGLAWQWIFWLNVPIGLARRAARAARGSRRASARTRALDLRGLALVTGGVLGVVWGLVRGNAAGWGSAEVVGALAARRWRCVAAFVAWELRARAPMLPMRFFRSRAFSAGNAAIFFAVGVAVRRRVLPRAVPADRARATARSTPGCGCCRGRRRCSSSRRSRARWSTASASGRSWSAGSLLQAIGMGWIALIADAGMAYGAADRAADRRRRRRLDVVPGGAELGRRRGAAGGDRQGGGHEQHDARARRRVRDRASASRSSRARAATRRRRRSPTASRRRSACPRGCRCSPRSRAPRCRASASPRSVAAPRRRWRSGR